MIMSSTFKPPLTETVDSSGNIIITPSTITPPPPAPIPVTVTTKLAAWQLAYQTWINNARAMGDNHFIIVENLNYVDMSHAGTAYAALTDPLNALYASFHDYYFFKYHPAWSIADADSFASMYL